MEVVQENGLLLGANLGHPRMPTMTDLSVNVASIILILGRFTSNRENVRWHLMILCNDQVILAVCSAVHRVVMLAPFE